MKLGVLLFAYGGVRGETHRALVTELATTRVDRLDHDIVTDPLISRGRSHALSQHLLTRQLDVVVMIDHDIEWPQGALVQLAQSALAADAVIGGVYSKRYFGEGLALEPRGELQLSVGLDEFHEVEHVGAGFLAVPRTVAERMVARLDVALDANMRLSRCLDPHGDAFYDFFRPYVADEQYVGEDVAFCARVWTAKERVLVWSKPMLGHVGEHVFTVRDACP